MNQTDTYFLPYQREWLNDDSPKKIAEKSRRIGLTHAQAYEDVRDCVTGEVEKVWFSSADESAAKEYIDDCAKFAGVFNIGAQMVGEVILDAEKDVKALQIDLANGARIHALTSNPKRFRSKGGKVILDEFAFHEDPRALFKASKPAIMWDFPLRIISTHNSTSSYFNQHFAERIKSGAMTGWSLHRIDIWKATEQGLLDKIKGRDTTQEERQAWIAGLAEDMAEEDFLEEFGCIPQAEKASFLDYQMLAEVERENVLWQDDFIPEHVTGLLYLGVDIGRRKDLTVKWLAEKIGGMLFTRKVMVEEQLKFSLQRRSLYELMDVPAMRRCCIDETGLGMQMAEEAADRYGKTRIEPIHFTNAMKEELAYGLRAQIEDKTLLIPESREVRQDLHSVKKAITPSGNIRFAQDAMGRKNTDGHADRFWAAALCSHAAKSYGGPATVASRKPRKSKSIMRRY